MTVERTIYIFYIYSLNGSRRSLNGSPGFMWNIDVPNIMIIVVGVFLGRQLLRDNRWRCSLHRRRRSATRGRTVRDLAQG
jgi:hypothetical protein